MHRLTLKERRDTGRKPTACQGGVTLSIDTSKAFDTVDRRILAQELRAARVPELGTRHHPGTPPQYWLLACWPGSVHQSGE